MTSTVDDRRFGASSSLAVKSPCIAVATSNITLTGLQTVGGVVLAEGDRVLVTGQTSSINNGIYDASALAWSRSGDFDGTRDVVNGTLIVVPNGSSAGVLYQLVGTNPIVPGTSSMTFITRDLPNVPFVRTPAEILHGIVPTNTSYPQGDLRRYGAAGSGSLAGDTGTDDSAALAAANTVGGEVIVDGGLIYRIGADETLTAALVIRSGSTLSVDSAKTLALNGALYIDSQTPFAGHGGVHFSRQSRPGRTLMTLPERAAGVPAYDCVAYDAFGDSYTSGTGVTAAQRYPDILATRLSCFGTYNNRGVGGRGVTTALVSAYTNLPKYGMRGRLITTMAGFNDLHFNGGGATTLQKIRDVTRSFIANAFLKTAVAIDDAAVTKTGVWTNATGGTWGDKGSISLGGHAMFSAATSTNKLAWSFTGESLVIGLWNSNGATYSPGPLGIYVDSVLIETVTTLGGTDGNVGLADTFEGLTHNTRVYTGLGSGAHTVEVRLTSNAVAMVDYFGTLAAPGECPSVLVGDVCYVDTTGYAGAEALRTKVIDDSATAVIRTEIDTFALLGYPVAAVPCNDYYDANLYIQGDHDHPNAVGHQQLAAAFSARCVVAATAPAPGCSFTKSAIQTIANATLTAITWAAAVKDNAGFRDAGNTSRIVCPFTGTLRLSGMISYVANATGIRTLAVYKNASGTILRDLAAMSGFVGNPNCLEFCVDFEVAAGDYLEIKTSQNSTGNLNIEAQSQVDVMMVR